MLPFLLKHKKFLSGILVIAAIFNLDRLYYSRPTTPKQLIKTSVMILNSAETAGGSGVIFKSSSSGSEILTNAHVCGLLDNGGSVITSDKKLKVRKFVKSKMHDLCMVEVEGDLGINIKVAASALEVGDRIRVVGHPALLPVIVQEGIVSRKMEINVNMCHKNDKKKCAEVKKFMSQLTSALILPGSSGSPVFNESGELAGVVFAGEGELSFSFIVPQQYVEGFVHSEIEALKWKTPVWNSNTKIL